MAAVVLAAWLALRPHPVPPAGRAADTSLPALPPQQAYQEAIRLALAGRSTESLPFFEVAERGVREDFAELHAHYAAALFDASFQVLPRRVSVAATRSSLERVRIVNRALDEMARATRFDMTNAARATLVRKHGEWLQVWGFNWEAFVEYRQAEALNPASVEEAVHAQGMMNLMRHPDRYPPDAVPITPGER